MTGWDLMGSARANTIRHFASMTTSKDRTQIALPASIGQSVLIRQECALQACFTNILEGSLEHH